MLQVNNDQPKPYAIKSIRKADPGERLPAGSACAREAGDGSDKPPC